MSKEKIANDYTNTTKDLYWTSHAEPDHSKIILTGAHKDNIGEAVVSKLFPYFEIETPTEKELNVRSTNDIKRYFAEREDLTHLICCHGYTHLDWIENQPEDAIDDAIQINLLGTIHLIKEFVQCTINWPWKKKIILIGSMAYNHVLNASSPYCAAKAGLNHFAECIAWELAPKGYDVFIINPSNTEDTPMTQKTIEGIMRYRGIDSEAALAYWGAILPKNKWLQKEDIAEMVYFLCTEKSGYLSGSHIDMKGGQR